MKTYEVMREIFNTCAQKWRIDTNFKDEWETDHIETLIASWYGGELPEYDVEKISDGTLIYTLDLELPERYSFTELK